MNPRELTPAQVNELEQCNSDIHCAVTRDDISDCIASIRKAWTDRDSLRSELEKAREENTDVWKRLGTHKEQLTRLRQSLADARKLNTQFLESDATLRQQLREADEAYRIVRQGWKPLTITTEIGGNSHIEIVRRMDAAITERLKGGTE